MEAFLFYTYLVLEAIAFFLSIFGNLVVCYVLIFKTKLTGYASRFILSVSIADILVGMIAIPKAVLMVRILKRELTKLLINHFR
jgi:7 transmembrane receptor (rhodopsin family)